MKHVNKAGKRLAEELKKPGAVSRLHRSTDAEIRLIGAEDFYKDLNTPVKGKTLDFFERLKDSREEMLDQNGFSSILEFNEKGRWRMKRVTSSQELKSLFEDSKKNFERYQKTRNVHLNNYLKTKEGFDDFYGASAGGGEGYSGGLEVRMEYSPLIGSPFFKQLYLFDYWKMHSKCFWYKNYSGIAKLIVDMTRNFVLGKGFNIDFDNPKAQEAWKRYEERSDIQSMVRVWIDELTSFGEIMIRRVPTPAGIRHYSVDPSTIWEIVTDPEFIDDVKYYHQQYNTQYQLYGTKDAPISKYIINQIPPQLMIHRKINVTSFEKRGRSDLLGALLYFKYYEDYMMAKLARAKNEAAFIWDVTIKGDEEAVQAYINSTESIVDVPPGSENVHNESITRVPLSPQFGKASGDQTAQDILSYVCMSVNIPYQYLGVASSTGFTKAGALVGTEPVAKKMKERQRFMEEIIREIAADVLMEAGLDPKKEVFEVNFPEIIDEDRSAKIQDVFLARDNEVISHKTAAMIVAKELNITKYDYEAEQAEIESDKASSDPLDLPGSDDLTPDITGGEDVPNQRSFDRASVRKDNKEL